MTLPFDPRAEKDAFATALSVFRARGAQNRDAEAVGALRAAIAQAEVVWAALTPHAHVSQSERELVRILLHLLLAAARCELARVHEQSALSPLLLLPAGTLPRCPSCAEERGLDVDEETQATAGTAAPGLAAGTILSCPRCGEGLYTVAASASVDDLVLDDGILLQPLNPTIPKREAWRAFACPRCGGQYYKEGKFHTKQGGWQ
jgi:hypothetical protein